MSAFAQSELRARTPHAHMRSPALGLKQQSRVDFSCSIVSALLSLHIRCAGAHRSGIMPRIQSLIDTSVRRGCTPHHAKFEAAHPRVARRQVGRRWYKYAYRPCINLQSSLPLVNPAHILHTDSEHHRRSSGPVVKLITDHSSTSPVFQYVQILAPDLALAHGTNVNCSSPSLNAHSPHRTRPTPRLSPTPRSPPS